MLVLPLLVGVVLVAAQGTSAAPLPQAAQSESPVRDKSNPSEMSDLRAKAEAGNAEAQLQLGKAYETGNGVPQSDTLAVAWYKKAAEQGNPAAENNLGIMYRLGQGVEKNKEEAVIWYRKAAKLGNAEAMFNLGASYYNGDGVAEDPTFAYTWFLLAEEAGNPAAGDAVRRSAAEMGQLLRNAILQVGEMYEKGDDLPQSYVQAAKWYRKAAGDSPQAAIMLASLLVAGLGVKQDFGEAMDLCRGAANKGYGPAQYCVGHFYQRGIGVAADPKEATKWFRRAAIQGHARATLTLAEMYLKGEGVPVDRPEAYWLLFVAYRGKQQEAKSQAHLLRQEMDKDEIKRTEKKLRGQGFDPKKVFQIIDDPTPPDDSNSRRTLPAVIR